MSFIWLAGEKWVLIKDFSRILVSRIKKKMNQPGVVAHAFGPISLQLYKYVIHFFPNVLSVLL